MPPHTYTHTHIPTYMHIHTVVMKTLITCIIEIFFWRKSKLTALGILWFLGMEPKLRVLLVRGLCGLNLSPVLKERTAGLSYQLAQVWDRGWRRRGEI